MVHNLLVVEDSLEVADVVDSEAKGKPDQFMFVFFLDSARRNEICHLLAVEDSLEVVDTIVDDSEAKKVQISLVYFVHRKSPESIDQ